MSGMTLIIGNRNYSSWSLRAWLAMRASGLEFVEIVIPLDQPDTRRKILEFSTAGRVPILLRDGCAIWESLAICEYAAELAPAAGLWPGDSSARAMARAVASEMHAGFMALRAELPMNIRANRPGVQVSEDARSDIRRVCEIWQKCRTHFGGGGSFLFGEFGIADAMFAPVASRFRTYRVSLDSVSREYADAVLGHSAMQEWAAEAEAEPWVLEREEVWGAGRDNS